MTGINTAPAIDVAERMLRALDGDIKIYREGREMEERGKKLSDEAQDIYNVSKTIARIVSLWRSKGRQALAMHPDLLSEIRVANNSKFPMEVLATLPFMNPMVLFTEPLEVPFSPNPEHKIRTIGFICYGLAITSRFAHGAHLVSDVVGTHDPEIRRFGVLLMSEVIDRQGKLVDVEENRMSFRMDGPTLSVAEHVAELRTRFSWSDHWKTEQGREQANEFLSSLVKSILGSLMYLCSTTLDVEVVPRTRMRRMPVYPAVSPKPIALTLAGWKFGSVLRTLRMQYFEKDESRGPGSGRPQLPQHRRCHWRTTWYGPGKTMARIDFISPYWTHLELLDAHVEYTMHKVAK